MEQSKMFLESALLSFKSTFGWLKPESYIMVKLIAPPFQMIFFCMVAKYCFHDSNLAPYVIGNALLQCVYNCIYGIGTVFVDDRRMGTLKCIITAPCNKIIFFFQRAFIHIFDSLTAVFLSLFVGSIIFDINLLHIKLIPFLLVILTAMVSVSCFGLFLAALSLITSETNLILNLATSLLIIMSGANFPRSNLPSLIYKISEWTPLSRSIEAASILYQKGSFSDIASLLLKEFFIGVAFFVMGYFMVQFTTRLAVKNASLDLL